MSNSTVDNNWFKLFAVMVVGSVAKTLFGPPPASRPVVNQVINETAARIRPVKDDES